MKTRLSLLVCALTVVGSAWATEPEVPTPTTAQAAPLTSQWAPQSKGGGDWAIGLRFGYPSGLSVKHYGASNNWDFTVGAWAPRYGDSWGLFVSGFYQKQQATGWANGLDWYYGIGGGFGARSWRYRDSKYRGDSEVFLAVGGQLGLEYTIPSAPIAFSLEVVPLLDVIPGFWPYMGGNLGIKYKF